MQITTPVTDYIRASLLTTNGDMVARIAGAPDRIPHVECFHAYRSGVQSFVTGVGTPVQLNAENFDRGTNFDSTVNYRFDVPRDGYYLFAFQVWWSSFGDQTYYNAFLITDLTTVLQKVVISSGNNTVTINGTVIIELTAGQWVQLRAQQNSGGNLNLLGGADLTFLCGYELL